MMNTENQLNYYSYALKNHLMNNEVFLKNDLEQLLQGKAIDFIEGKNFTDVAVFILNIVRRLNIIFGCEDNDGNGLSQHSKRIGVIDQDNNFPKKLELELIELEEIEIENNEDAFYDFSDALDCSKYEILEKWFLHVWKEVAKNITVTQEVYFSIHDTIHKTRLN